MSARPRILCVHSEVGGAHRAVAEALCEDLGGRADVEVVDLLESSSRFCNGSVKLYSPVLSTLPRFYNWFYDVTTTRLGWEAVYRTFLRRLMLDRVVDLLRERRPACVVSLWAVTSRIVVDALRRAGAAGEIPLAVVLVDLFSLHRAWAEPAADLTLVPTGEAREELVAYGVDRRRIRIARYPVRRAFRTRGGGSEAASREPGDRPRVLLMGGGDGVLDMGRLSRGLLSASHDVRIDAVPGRNAALRRELETLSSSDHGRLYVAREWSEVPALMAAADLVVTKPGPSTILEALELERPLLLTGFVPRQEEGNVRYVVSKGFGTFVEPCRAVQAVRHLLGCEELSRLGRAARREKQRLPTGQAAEAILELASAGKGDRA